MIMEKQDLTYLKWSHIRNSSGTAGTFLKSGSALNGEKIYYKLSNFDIQKGVVGHECINEIIVCRLLECLGVEHLNYKLIYADIDIEGRTYSTYLCASHDFKERGESKSALDDYFRLNCIKGESHYEFCVRQGWKEYIDRMIAIDYIILNRDRHGGNIEVLRNPYKKTLRIAPLFDHGLSLIVSCDTPEAVNAFDIMSDSPCNNFIGTRSCKENLDLIIGSGDLFERRLTEKDKAFILHDLEGVLSSEHLEKIWRMIYERYRVYERVRNM